MTVVPHAMAADSADTFTRPLWWIAGALVLAHLLVHAIRLSTGHDYVFGLVPLFDLDDEHNVPTLYSTLLLIAAGLLAAWFGRIERAAGSRWARHWWFLAVGLLLIGLDEGVAIHERVSRSLGEAADGAGGQIALKLVAVAGLAAMAVLYRGFVFHLSRPVRGRLVLAVAVFFFGAVVVDGLNEWIAARGASGTPGQVLLFGVEEGAELAGVILLLTAWLAHARERFGWWSGRVDRNVPEHPDRSRRRTKRP